MTTNFSSDDIPNRFDYATAQDRIYANWEKCGYFHAEPDNNPRPYSIVIPPPNVTGALHLGHALNNTLQDVLIRMKRMQGYNTLWMPGTDHAGIATQAVVERRLKEEEGKTRHDLGRAKLVERIWAWKDQYEARILSQLKRMGCSCDWQRTRFTLDETCARAVRRTFFDLFKKQLIFRGKRLVNWDTFLQTAVSDDEVFHETVKASFWHIRYPVIPVGGTPPDEPTHVSIATTRPETMLGDTAVAVHPDPAKALDRAEVDLVERLDKAAAKDKPAIEAQLENVRQRRKTHLPALLQLRDMAKAGRKLRLPLADRDILLIADEWAKPEMGSGCVKITPAHDINDEGVWRRHPHIGVRNIMNPDGTLNDEVPEKYRGLKMQTTARQAVLVDLERGGFYNPETDREDREIDLAHSDRSKTPIEPYLTDQWFVKMGDRDDGTPGLAQMAMDAVTSGQVKIFPERYAKTYLDWLGEKRDWCISRQLWWGHQIPVSQITLNANLYSKDTGSVTESMPRVEQEFAVALAEFATACGISGDVVIAPSDLGRPVVFLCARTEQAQNEINSFFRRHYQGMGEQTGPVEPNLAKGDPRNIPDGKLDGLMANMKPQETDVLDTWFSSALWPHSTFGWPEKTPELKCFYPTSVLITSRGIITLWVARMVLTGLNNMGEVPFREVFIHPTILDGDGETMSKSKGNGVDPLDIIDKFGPDALRYGLAYLTTETQDVRMPVQYECPHCEALTEQTKKNRTLPRVACKKCGKEFSTQWAEKEADKALPRGAVVSERFELARNFCNKLWNASRFALLNLDGFKPGGVSAAELALEDRWILSRLTTVTLAVTAALDKYHFADAARALYDFAWDEFCSFYVEMLKGRLQDDRERPAAQRVLAHTLDTLLRLLHPMIPFITEEVWQLLGDVAPRRGLPSPVPAAESIMLARWPVADVARQDRQIEASFARFQAALAALREIRSRQNISPKEPLSFGVKCDAETAALLAPLASYFKSMANAAGFGFGPEVQPPKTQATVNLPGMDVYVDLVDFIDVAAEMARNQKQEEKLLGFIKAKQAKLASAGFVDRAPPDVVNKERAGLAELQEQLAAVRASLAELRSS